MRPFLIAAALLFTSVPLAPGQEHTVVVRVLTGGKPAAGAKVWVLRSGDKELEPAALVADAAGKVHVKVKATGRWWFGSAVARDSHGRLGQCDLRLNQIGEHAEIDLELLDTGPRGGRVTDPKDQPVAGAEIVPTGYSLLKDGNDEGERRPRYFSLPEWESARQTTRTDKEGRFVVTGVPNGYGLNFRVQADRHGEARYFSKSDAAVEVKLAVLGMVVVRFSGPIDPAELKGVSWRLEVAKQPKQAIGNVAPAGFHYADFDGKAEYTIAHVVPGRYRFQIYKDAKVPALPGKVDEFEVAPGGKTVVTVPFTPAARITGKVIDQATGKGLPGVSVFLGSRDAGDPHYRPVGTVKTDAAGNYMVYGPAGWLSVWVSQPPDGYVVQIGPRGDHGIEPVQVAAGKSHTLPDIALLRAVDLRGVVVLADGKPAAKAVVNSSMFGYSYDGAPVIVDEQGRFVLSNLRPDDVIEPRIRLGNAVNLVTEFDPGQLKAPVKIEISEKNAVRFRGQVTDQKGSPLAGAKVWIGHLFRGVGRNASMGTGLTLGELRTGPDGRFESPGLWAKDQYSFKVRAEGYGEAASKHLQGAAGAVLDVPTIVLTRSAMAVAGTVVSLDGKPVAGATVFGVDGPSPFRTTTAADGRFTLKGYFEAPGFVFAKKEGHRLTALPVTPGGKPVVVTLRSLADPPPPAPRISEEHVAAEKNLTRLLLTTLWGIRSKHGYERHTVDAMARFDLDTAKAWRDEEKQRSEGKVDFTYLIDQEHRQRTLFDRARKDIDEALEVLRTARPQDVFREALDLGQRLAAVDPAKAERLAEEAVVRARQMKLPEAVWSLARAGELAIRAGNAAGGAKVIREAADLAEKSGTDGLHGYARGLVAARLAPVDWPRAKKLLDSFKEPNDYNRYLRTAAAQLASTDLAKAKELLGGFRPSNAHYIHEARLLVAFRIANKHPDEAVALVEGTSEVVYRVKGLLGLAERFVSTDRQRAIRMIDQAFDQLDKGGDAFRGWSGSGGAAGLAALAVYKAKEIGHPELATLVARALALRPSGRGNWSPEDRPRELVGFAMVLALTDPAAARHVLAGVAPPEQFVKRALHERRAWLFVLALADPARAVTLMDRQLEGLENFKGGGNALGQTGLVELSSILTARNRLEAVGRYGSVFHEIREED